MRVSTRLPSRFDTNALTQALEGMRAQGLELLDLTVSNPTSSGLVFPADTLRAALADPEVSRYCPDAMGGQAARDAIAAWHGHGVRPGQVLLTASTSEAYAWLFKVLCDPGDDVVVPSPSYPLFEWLARLEGITTSAVPAYFHERWHLDLEALEQAVHPRTRAIVIVNPNNPTGQFLSRSEWSDLTRLCARKSLALIVDEVFSDYALEAGEDRLATALDEREPPCPVFVLSGLSKIAALPQVKLGWLIACGTPAMESMHALAFVADHYLSASATAQLAAPAILHCARDLQSHILQRLRANLETLDGALKHHPHLSRLPVEGGWTVLLRRPAVDSDEACALRLLEESQVLVHPGHFFDLPGDGYLVLSLLTQEDRFRNGLARIFPALG